MLVRGIDASHWQGSIDPDAVKKAGYEFVFWKATEGTSFTDPTFARAREACQGKLLFAGYHVGRPGSGRAQYDHYARVSPDGPAILDIEPGPSIPPYDARSWIAAAWATGRPVLVYGLPEDVIGFAGPGVYTWQVAWSRSHPVREPVHVRQVGSARVPGVPGTTDIDETSTAILEVLWGGEAEVFTDADRQLLETLERRSRFLVGAEKILAPDPHSVDFAGSGQAAAKLWQQIDPTAIAEAVVSRLAQAGVGGADPAAIAAAVAAELARRLGS